ncbi:MAG: CvpA family protein [Chloroflexi bacterium]|nr:CvpA family protein [Chloroflexota bacterium]
MNWLDGAVMAAAVVMGLLGLKLGLLRAVFMAGGVVAAVILAAQISEPLAAWLTENVRSESLASVIAYGVVFTVVVAVAWFAGWFVGRVMRLLFLGWVDSIGGALLGVGAGLLAGGALIAVLARFAFMVPTSDLERIGEILADIDVRENLKGALVDSKLVPGYLEVRDRLPGDVFGMIPGDYDAAFEALELAREIEGEGSE